MLSSCSNIKENNVTISNEQYQLLIQENSSLKAEIDELQNLISELKKNGELKELNNTEFINVAYIGYDQQYRYIEADKEIFWYPSDSALKVTSLPENALVEVLFAGYPHENEIWLFVVVPVFDTPSNNRGWIRESDTQKYTKQILKNIEAGIIIRKGTIGYNSGGGEVVTEQDSKGLVEKRENGKVLVMFAGGYETWYNEEDLAYPDIPDE